MPDVAARAADWGTALGTRAGPAFFVALLIVMAVSAGAWRALHRSGPATRAATVSGPSTTTVALILLVAVATLLAVVTALTRTVALDRFDGALARALSQQLGPVLLSVFATVTHLGDEVVLTAVVIAVAVVLAARRDFGLTAAWLVTCVGNGVLNPALKQLFERVRPVHDPIYVTTSTYSFPSGHASGSVVVYGMLAYVLVRLVPRAGHPAIVVATAATVFTVGASRVFLQVHWASDVVAGFASGTAWLSTCVLAIAWLRRRDGGPGP